MGVAMNAMRQINNAFATGAAAIAGGVALGKMNKANDAIAGEKRAAEKAKLSYGNELNRILGEAFQKNPKLQSGKYAERAYALKDYYTDVMMNEREVHRAYRNSLPTREERNAAEIKGQAQKQQHFADFERDINKIGKPGRPSGSVKGGKK